MDKGDTIERLAIIGMTGRFPGAKNVEELWRNTREGTESISHFSRTELEEVGIPLELLYNPSYVRAQGVLEDIELFDASFFGYSPREAECIDPQQRIFLECAYEALEVAGYDPERTHARIGLYAGAQISSYLLNNLYANRQVWTSLDSWQILFGNDKDFLTTRVSYKLHLTGPSITVQTACSTSLVAVHVACQSLLSGECDIALAGGVSINSKQKVGYLYQPGSTTSPDGHCRAFDAKAHGSVDGSGVGLVVLKRLSEALADGDYIHAVICGSAVNNDGHLKVGYTAPSVEGQADVIAEALALAGVAPETIGYIETHGTGTVLGDPIEFAALAKVFQPTMRRRGSCAIGSLKTNIGHLGVAAGISGLIKTVQSLKYRLLPPSLHFEEPNPQIDFASSPFYVNTQLREWPDDLTPRRAGVSAFGVGGTNAHVILEQAPDITVSDGSRPAYLLLLSAKTSTALESATEHLVMYLKEHPDANLADVAYTLQVGRHRFSHRRMLVCNTIEDAVQALETRDPLRTVTAEQDTKRQQIAFLFPGSGDQYEGIAYQLYQVEPLFRKYVDRSSEILIPLLGLDIREVLCSCVYHTDSSANRPPLFWHSRAEVMPDHSRQTNYSQNPRQTDVALPILFVFEYALAQLWISWVGYPHAMLGNSIGEYVAACLAGVFSLEDALTLVAKRAQLIQSLPGGAMLAIALSEKDVTPFLQQDLSLAAIHGPSQCVVAGPQEDIDALAHNLSESGIAWLPIQVEHAFHSIMMKPIVDDFFRLVKTYYLKPPQIPFLSNVTGTWITTSEATDPNYWARQLYHTVRLADGLQLLRQEPQHVALLEIGPGHTLSTLAHLHPRKSAQQLVLASFPHYGSASSHVTSMLNALGRLWLVGVEVDWSGFYKNERRRRLPLPTYPFDRQRYWIEPQGKEDVWSQKQISMQTQSGSAGPCENGPHSSLHPRSYRLGSLVAPRNQLEQSIAAIWQEVLGIDQISIYDNFFEIGGHSLTITQINSRLQTAFPIDIPLRCVFEAPTIAALAELIENLLIEKIDEMSEEVVQNYL